MYHLIYNIFFVYLFVSAEKIMEEDMNKLVNINVGGILFAPKKALLMNCPFFKSMFDDLADGNFGPGGELPFIDRSGEAFIYVLSLLRDPEYKFPKKYEEELDYFNIDKSKVKFDNIEEFADGSIKLAMVSCLISAYTAKNFIDSSTPRTWI